MPAALFASVISNCSLGGCEAAKAPLSGKAFAPSAQRATTGCPYDMFLNCPINCNWKYIMKKAGALHKRTRFAVLEITLR